MEISAIIFILILFAILMAFFSQSTISYFPIAILVGFIAIISMIGIYNVDEEIILGFINFKTLIFIFAMQIIITYAAKDKVLEYMSIKLIQITKGNNRLLFYGICIFTGFIVSFIEDLSLSLILIPIVIRACKALDIPAGTYMMGITITINIGAILTPISSLKNLIIGQEFGWGFKEYFFNLGILFFVALFLTVFLMDWFIVRKEEKPTERNKILLLELVDAYTLIENKKNFFITSIVLSITFILMLFGIAPSTVSLFFAAILILLHNNEDFKDIKEKIPWELLIAFAVLFVLSNSLSYFGLSSLIADFLTNTLGNNIYLSVLITLLISSLLSAFLAGTPVTIILLPIFSELIKSSVFPNPIIIAFISGVNMAGNFLPQGSACDLLTLNLAKEYKVQNLDYRRLLKYGSRYATLHFILVLVYTMFYTLILSG